MKRGAFIIAITLLVGCNRAEQVSQPGMLSTVAQLSDGLRVQHPEAMLDARVAQQRQCLAAIEQVREHAQPTGTPALDARRARILALAKGEPVIFIREPVQDPPTTPAIGVYRSLLARTQYPSDMVRRLLVHFRQQPGHGAQVLLREGYLYADDEGRARALVENVGLEHVSDAPALNIERGPFVLRVELDAHTGRYRYADGPERGLQAKLLLFDRVVPLGPAPEPLHRDLRTLRRQLGFDQVRVEAVTDRAIVASLRYGDGLWIPTLLESEGARALLVCEAVPPEAETQLRALRAKKERRVRVVDALRQAMLDQIQEQLPFDEPRTEYGQQDGSLRPRWEQAYRAGLNKYRYNGDVYPVFNPQGQPAVPQVCLDFLKDTLERASGSWWTGQQERRERKSGKLDFGQVDIGNPRSVDDFIAYARQSQWFDVLDTSARDRIEFGASHRFLSYLERHGDDYEPGDIVIVRGYLPRPRDRKHVMHYHSFFVYEDDPVTGVPMVIAGNAGRPLLTSWLREMQRTPRRSIWYRLRPRLEWLESVLPASDPILEPARLTAAAE